MKNELIRASYGTAISLGLLTARQDIAPTTAYLLYDRGCIGTCSFCSRAGLNEKSKRLSRIIWPEYPLETLLKKLSSEPKPFKHICLQTAYNPAKENELKELVKQILSLNISCSIALSPSQTEYAKEMLKMGVRCVGIGLDCASETTYKEHKHKNWAADYPNLIKLTNEEPNKIEVHLIFGLGDTEKVFMSRIQDIINAKGKVALFALTPLNGQKAPQISAYRRVQAFRFMCENKGYNISSCSFENEKLTSFNLSKQSLISMLQNGSAFKTAGCELCNRPYYNERPGQEFYNFPRQLTAQELEMCVSELDIAETKP